MYGVVFSFKDPFDTKDMRSTGGGDAATTSISRRATTCWSSSCATRARSSSPRRSTPNTTAAPAIRAAATAGKVLPSTLGYQRSTWGGNPSNPYDTTRSASLGSSSGSALSVSTNLVMASLGEETRASCRGPSNHNAVALILPHKAMLGFDGGAIGADIYCDRTGILAARIADCAKVLDALKDPERAITIRAIPTPRCRALRCCHAPTRATRDHAGTRGRSRDLRIGIIRESMLYPGSKTEEPIVTAAAKEIKTVLRAGWARRWWNRPIRCGRPIPTSSR